MHPGPPGPWIVLRVMVLMMLADAEIDEAEIERVLKIFYNLTGMALTSQQVHQEIERTHMEGAAIVPYLNSIAGTLAPHQKEMIIQAAYYVAAADGIVEDEEEDLLMGIGQALYMTEVYIRGIIHSIEQPR